MNLDSTARYALVATNIIRGVTSPLYQALSRIALRYGSGFIRNAFIVVVSLLILKTFYDAYV